MHLIGKHFPFFFNVFICLTKIWTSLFCSKFSWIKLWSKPKKAGQRSRERRSSLWSTWIQVYQILEYFRVNLLQQCDVFEQRRSSYRTWCRIPVSSRYKLPEENCAGISRCWQIWKSGQVWTSKISYLQLVWIQADNHNQLRGHQQLTFSQACQPLSRGYAKLS